MADEYSNRKDIERLYDLVYRRTSDSPIAQQYEVEELRQTLIDNYALLDTVNELVNQLWNKFAETDTSIETINTSLDTKVSSSDFENAMQGKADATNWQTIYTDMDTNGITALLEANGIHVRLIITGTDVAHTTNYINKFTIPATHYDYFPQYTVYSIGNNVEYRFRYNSSSPHTGYFEVKSLTGSTVTQDINHIIEWTI